MIRTRAFLFLALALILIGCSPDPWRGHRPLAPHSQSWQGITPGETTEEQVLSILGQPSSISDYDDVYYYEYHIEGLSSIHYNGIYFRKPLFRPRVVSLLDVETRVNPLAPHTISDVMNEYGVPFDTAARRRFYDITPVDVAYVLADQGLAFMGVPAEFIGLELPAETMQKCIDPFGLRQQVPQRYFINDFGGYINFSDPCDVVVRQVIFEPMGFDKFWSQYGYQLGRIYLDEGYLLEEK